MEQLTLDGLAFDIRRSNRRKTIGITVDHSGELLIHAPDQVELVEVERWARRKLLWVYRKLALKEQLAPRMRPPEFVTGESLRYLGRLFRLVVVHRQEVPLKFDGRRFTLRRDARAAVADHFRAWYIAAGTDWVKKRVSLLARRTIAAPASVEVRDLGFRWGSCTKNGAVFFNWRLLQLPVRLADYVICHELVHLVEGHHGPAFWKLLDAVQPDWRERKRELAEQAQSVQWFG